MIQRFICRSRGLSWRHLAHSKVPYVQPRLMSSSYSGDSITYSGGHAAEGQGGFYGSGGARAIEAPTTEEQRPGMLALATDVQHITKVMQEVDILEQLLEEEEGKVTTKSIELRSAIKKLMTSHDFMNSLDRLELKGEPVWGLSSNERDLIVTARHKVNEC